jgi:sugar phosphate isomerase/epimerase
MNSHHDIRIGTLAGKGQDTANYIRQILPHGFESFEINFWKTTGDVNLKQLATEVKQVLTECSGAACGAERPTISCLGVYGNPLVDAQCPKDWAKLIDACEPFGCDLVCGFAGRVVDQPIPASMKQFKKVFGPLTKRAADKGVRLAFENCDMGGDWRRGDWNIANAPTAWEMMFHEVTAPNLGLEWEPCHQMVSLVDPIAQLRKWAPKVFHLHGKDATVDWAQLRATGLRGGQPWVWHRTPGFGDSNWTDIISILRQHGFKGAIDIEGWHDPVYRNDLEMTGQVRALNYLKECRGGAFIPNPV